jgi:hypothetical protein
MPLCNRFKRFNAYIRSKFCNLRIYKFAESVRHLSLSPQNRTLASFDTNFLDFFCFVLFEKIFNLVKIKIFLGVFFFGLIKNKKSIFVSSLTSQLNLAYFGIVISDISGQIN